MKKEVLGSILSLTASLSAVNLAPEIAVARPKLSEPNLPRTFTYKLKHKARLKQDDGTYIAGQIYLSLTQERYTPVEQNLLHSEMMGHLEFVSDEAIEVYRNGERGQLRMAVLGGENGGLLFDLVHKIKDATGGYRTYQIYECDSTRRYCSGRAATLDISDKEGATLSLYFEEWSAIEIYNGKWTSGGYIMPLELQDK